MVSFLSNPGYLGPPLVALVVSLVLTAVVLRWARRTFSSGLFCCLLLSIGLWGFLLFGMRSSPDVHRAVAWDRALCVVGLATFILFYHFTIAYTNTKRQGGILIIAYLLLVVSAVFSPTTLLVEEMRLESYGYAPIPGTLLAPIFVVGILLMGGAVYNLLRRYKVSISYEERNRIPYLAIAVLFPLSGALLDSFSNLPPAGIWGNLMFSIICTIAIVKYHLLDIRVIVRRSLVYFLVSAIIAIPYVSVLFLLQHILNPMWEPWWVHPIIILLLAIVLRPLYSRAQILVDRLFYRKRYDFLRELEDFSQETHDISDLNQLFSSLVKLISRALQASGVYLLLSSDSGDFLVVGSAGGNTSQLAIKSGSPLLRWLESNEGVLRHRSLDTTPQLQALTLKVTSELERMRAKLYIPLKTKNKALIGVLILCEKLSEQPYSEEDERLVVTVASRAVVELENARLYALERSTRRELEKKDEQKTEFLHQVAHELKTPLTSIISSSEILYEQPAILDDLKERLIENIKNSADVMDRRVSELLDVARIQTDNLLLKKETIDINGFLSNIALQLQSIFRAKEQTLKLEIANSLPKINADRSKLEEILYNLLTNANKYSPISSNVVLRANENNGQVILEVEDSAPAISKEDKERIFEPYYRSGDSNKRQRFPGLGLGLFIVKNLIELHQGRIWVKSRATKGNKFVFSLPTLGRELRESGDY